jgi:hypothetical protein
VVGECMQEVFQVHGPSVTSGPDTLWGTASVEKQKTPNQNSWAPMKRGNDGNRTRVFSLEG